MNKGFEGLLLRVFVGEKDKQAGVPLSDWIVHKALELGLSGATVFRGMEGFGSHARIHNVKLIDLSEELPVMVEIIDSAEKINLLLAVLEDTVKGGMATTSPVTIYSFAAPGSNR